MKQKLQTILKKSAYWLGIVVFGTVLGLTLQFAKAWTEPTQSPPGGNVGAPINTSSVAQTKQGNLNVHNGYMYAYSDSGTYGLLNYAGYGVYTDGNMYANDYYIAKISKWASTLGGSITLGTASGFSIPATHSCGSDSPMYSTRGLTVNVYPEGLTSDSGVWKMNYTSTISITYAGSIFMYRCKSQYNGSSFAACNCVSFYEYDGSTASGGNGGE